MKTTNAYRVAMVFCAVTVLLAGCATRGQTGLLTGGGIGAVMGQLIGHDTESTLIGAGIGAVGGYIIGNEKDKEEVRKREAPLPQELEALAGTTWVVVSVNPQPKEPFKSMVVSFGRDGTMLTTKTDANGVVSKKTERYRIVGSTLIISKPDYIINARYAITDNQMTVDASTVSVVLQRI